MGKRRAVVIGGGLAGMVVARELAERGMQVRLLESSGRLGGKAGARKPERTEAWEDHGYHVFPGWYVNTRRLLDEIDCTRHLIDIERFHFLRRREFPRFITMEQMSTLPNMLRNLRNGLLPWPEMLLSFYFLLDLVAEPFSNRYFLDRVSANGFLRSRFYANERISMLQHQSVLQASSIPYYELSAMTLQKLFKAWMKVPAPVYSILNGNLQERFIEPFERHLVEKGVEIIKGCEVKRLGMAGEGDMPPVSKEILRASTAPPKVERSEGRVRGLRLGDGTPLQDTSDEDVYVLAVPHAKALELVTTAVFEAEQPRFFKEAERRGLADLVNLRSAPMAALHVHFKRRIPNLPKEHVNLVDSRFGLSFIDISQHWEGIDHTALNCIASYFEPLRQVGREHAERVLLSELFDYLPGLTVDDIESTYFQTHEDQPLFLNTIGAWHFRPRAVTGIPNLFVAGDYCRSDADLTTMESAVIAGLETAEKILAQEGLAARVKPLPLPAPSPLLMRFAKYAALPLVVPLAIWCKWRAQQEVAASEGASADE